MSIFLTSFPYLDYIISRCAEKVKHFDEVFLNFFKKIGGQKGGKRLKLLYFYDKNYM
nr:MAG TPA: hypothetical protein [Caudoviricetes sp.]